MKLFLGIVLTSLCLNVACKTSADSAIKSELNASRAIKGNLLFAADQPVTLPFSLQVSGQMAELNIQATSAADKIFEKATGRYPIAYNEKAAGWIFIGAAGPSEDGLVYLRLSADQQHLEAIRLEIGQKQFVGRVQGEPLTGYLIISTIDQSQNSLKYALSLDDQLNAKVSFQALNPKAKGYENQGGDYPLIFNERAEGYIFVSGAGPTEASRLIYLRLSKNKDKVERVLFADQMEGVEL